MAMLTTAPQLRDPRAPSAANERWARRRDAAIAVLGWLIIVALVVWAASHVIRALLILIVAALLAYALMPAVKFLSRFLPRPLAILVVYLAFVSVIGALGYLIVSTAVAQVGMLTQQVSTLITPGKNGADSPLIARLRELGISQSQIQSVGDEILRQTQVLAAGVVPFLEGIFNGMLDAVLVTVLSIYLLLDGQRVVVWLRTSAPVKHRPRVSFMLLTFQRVVGGYIRGQLILSTLIGALVGGGMAALHVPYAVLLGVLAFILEFIPVIGVFVSGAACVLIALTQSWVLAVVVLAYFVIVHIIEGDVVGPRVVGRAVGVHPAVSIFALLAGGELFGIWGALFASPLAGLIQAVLSEVWREWRLTHAHQFPEQFGASVVPVTTADAAESATFPDAATIPPPRERTAHPPDTHDADDDDAGATRAMSGGSLSRRP
jgi:predicted PurR-regulated permease PerM